jgi:hypothetical protein
MTEPRKPADHKAKAEPAAKPEGWDLLLSFDRVPVWDQAELLEIVKPLMASSEEDAEGLDLMSFDVRIVGQLARKLSDLAVDKGAYTAFVSGPDALERAVNLGIAYAAQLGKSGDSATS